MAVLEAREVYGGYGGIDILQGCGVEAEAGQVAVIVGPNGAGKSTLLKAIFGVLRPRAGTVTLDGVEVTGKPTTELVRLGLGFVPQERNVFPSLTVHENMEMGA